MKFLREPLVHFLLLGAALFAAFELAKSRPDRPGSGRRLHVTPFVAERLAADFRARTGQPATATEREALIAAHVREEILVREARARGLDRDDPVVREQLRRRMEAAATDGMTLPAPDDRELAAFLAGQAARFRAADGRVPPLEEIRPAVAAAWQQARRQEVIDAAYRKLRDRYEIVIEPPAAAAPVKP